MKLKEYVSKRILGFVSYVVGLGMSVADGFGAYNVEPSIVLFILGNGSVLLGIDAYKELRSGTIK